MLKPVVSFMLALMLAGCLSQGRDFVTAPVKDIVQNVTTQNQIFNYFGEPYQRGLENGYETWTYFYNYWEFVQLKEARELTIAFNKDRTVRSYSFNSR